MMPEEPYPELSGLDRQLDDIDRSYRPELRMMQERASVSDEAEYSPVDYLRYAEVSSRQWRQLRKHKVNWYEFRHAHPVANESPMDFIATQETMMDYLARFDEPGHPNMAVVIQDADNRGPSNRFSLVFEIPKEKWQTVHGER